MNQVQELFICSIDGHLIGEQKGSDEFFIGHLNQQGRCQVIKARAEGEGLYRTATYV